MIAPALLLLAAGCATAPPVGVPLTGRWGGEHVGLELAPSGGTVDYDCAAGRIDGPLLPRPDGTFQVMGTHTPGTGGPERVGVVPPSFAARYVGTVRGDRLTLQVRVENGVLIGPVRLRRGAEPMLLRCL
ncbi:MAG: hypothetical protein H0U83_05725 [Sphingomonas sp.]|nr:hypothetical protein [Sphingomonas sp.]